MHYRVTTKAIMLNRKCFTPTHSFDNYYCFESPTLLMASINKTIKPFIDQFNVLIINYVSLSNTHKLYYLKSCLVVKHSMC